MKNILDFIQRNKFELLITVCILSNLFASFCQDLSIMWDFFDCI